ncbi:hypothetical protein MMC25_004530 [Agyrium rufum]|nr:hypothetical protein [Agyrium rufum]
MKALRLTRDSANEAPNAKLEDISIPEPGPGEVLVQVHASAIQPSDVLNVKAEKPANLSFAQAACLGVPFSTAILCLDKTQATSGNVVLVISASGAVGSAALQLAKIRECRTLGASRRDTDEVNTAKDPELSALATLTDGKGVDVTVDTVGDPKLMRAAINHLGTKGRYVWIASPCDGSSSELSFDIKNAYRKEHSLIGVNSLAYSVGEMAEKMRSIKPHFESGAATSEIC